MLGRTDVLDYSRWHAVLYEGDEGVPIPPGTFSVDLLGDYASFALPGPPPIPAERCAEGYNYPFTDTNCRS